MAQELEVINTSSFPYILIDTYAKDGFVTGIWMVGFWATFIGVGIGGIVAYFINGFTRSIGAIYAVCAGLILGLISFELAPEALWMGSWVVLLIGFLAGVLLFNLMHMGVYRKSIVPTKTQKTGLFLALIITVHNVPMGVVFGASEQSDVSYPLLKAIVLHNIPEGMILFTPLFLIGLRFVNMVLLSIVVSLPVAIGAYIGGEMQLQNDLLWSFLLSLIVGTIYMVTIKEILPESVKYSSNRHTVVIASLSFLLLGAYLFFFSH